MNGASDFRPPRSVNKTHPADFIGIITVKRFKVTDMALKQWRDVRRPDSEKHAEIAGRQGNGDCRNYGKFSDLAHGGQQTSACSFRCRLVSSQQVGRKNRYKLQPEPLVELKQRLAFFEQYWDEQLAKEGGGTIKGNFVKG